MALKKEPILHPTASLEPYPINMPPIRAVAICFLLFIFFNLNCDPNKVAAKEPKITPIFKMVNGLIKKLLQPIMSPNSA